MHTKTMLIDNSNEALIGVLLHCNGLLTSLGKADLLALRPHLRAVILRPNGVLYECGADIDTIYFPCNRTIVKFTTLLDEGGDVDTLIVGREGAIGGFGSWGKQKSFARVHSAEGGDLLALPVAKLEVFGDRAPGPALERLLARYADCLVAEMLQIAACNASHTIDQRVARLLLAISERVGSKDVPFTQEQISQALSVQRTYVSRVLARFRKSSVIVIRRGHVIINSREQLREHCCGCNDAIKHHYATILGKIYSSPA